MAPIPPNLRHLPAVVPALGFPKTLACQSSAKARQHGEKTLGDALDSAPNLVLRAPTREAPISGSLDLMRYMELRQLTCRSRLPP